LRCSTFLSVELPRLKEMARPQRDPPVADRAPSAEVLTAYDNDHLVIYLRLEGGRSQQGEPARHPRLSIPSGKRSPRAFEDFRTPEDEPIPPSTLAELRRDMERHRLISDQIRQIEDAHLERL
jgi:hypothetical protein